MMVVSPSTIVYRKTDIFCLYKNLVDAYEEKTAWVQYNVWNAGD